MASIIVALAMIVPGVVLTQQLKADAAGIEAGAQSGPTTFAWVNFNSPEHVNAVRDIGANIVSLRETGAYVRVTEGQRNYLSERFDVSDMPWRTTVNLAEQGIKFDSQVGYELADEWRNPNSNEYLVQFVAPTETAWNDGVVAASGKILREIGDNLLVVKMTENQKAKIEKLDYVQWVGVYEPGFKVDKNIPESGIVKITAEAYEIADTQAVIGQLTELGAAGIEDTEYGRINCYLDASAIPNLARLDTVKLVWFLGEMKTLTNVGGRIVQAHDLWVNTVSNFPSNIMGQGQIVHVQDTGLDATHRDFTSGPLGNRIGYAEATTDAQYHGTHCCGIACGNGYDMEAYLGLSTTNRIYNELAATNPAGRPDRMGFAGRAPEATLYSRAGLTDADWNAGFTYGARVFSNSWGPALMSNSYDSTADSFMTTNPTALVVFAIGNDGPRNNTASGGGNGKLGIGVGAVENMRPVDFDSSDDYEQQIGFSSRGPVADGRIKPDVCEIGTAVYSTLSDDSAAENTGYELYNLISVINSDTSDALGDYISLQGTSMACPAVAGDAILIRDYLQDIRGIATGSIYGLMMKGLLIHGAEDMGLGFPSYDQGWGRVNVRNSVAPAFPNVLQWYYHSTGIASGTWSAASAGIDLTVIDRTVPLKVTLVHNDASGSGELTYDLDLRVTGPDGTIYWGNAFRDSESVPMPTANNWGQCAFPSWVGGEAYDFDEEDDGGDDENNVEVVLIPANKIRLGLYVAEVIWKSSTARPFFIAATGGFNANKDVNVADNAYRVTMNLDVPRVVPERDDYGEAVFKGAQSGSIIVPYWINNGGTTNDQYALSTPILPTGFTVTFTSPTSPVSINAGLRVHGYVRIAIDGTVAAGTYTLSLRAISNNDGTAPVAQSQIKFQIDVVTSKTPPVIPVAKSEAHEDAPYFVSWYSGGKDYIACAYRQDEQFGERVYFTLSSDGGKTWSKGQPISQRSWSPGYVGIAYANSGTYEGRLFIAYNAWNPNGYGGSTADTRCSYIKGHYADAPYTSWTEVNMFVTGEGVQPSLRNGYRTIDINWVPSVNQFYLTVENFGYTGNDLNTASQASIDCIGKKSTDGGATWPGLNVFDRIDAAAGDYYFFPNTEIDTLGNMVLFFYERDTSDAAQDRDGTYRYYSGTWGTYFTCWDSLDNLMMPQTVTTDEGANGNRAWGAYLKGGHTDGDRQLHLMYTDNPNAATPTFNTNSAAGYGPYGPVLSDHDYGTRFIFDLEYVNSYLYFFGHRNVAYDPFGQPNMLMIHDDDILSTPAPVVDYMTLDSFVHGKQRATEIFGANKVFVAQNSFTKDVGHDILGQIVHYDWRNDTDTYGPVTEFVSTSTQIMAPGTTFHVVANVHDWQTGGNNINLARYRTDVNPTVYVNMASMDGSFNSPAEAVTTSAAVSTTGWLGGWHTVWVSGRDTIGNWGAEESVQVLIVAPEPPFAPTTPKPDDGATGVELSRVFSVYYEDYENNAGTVRFYWKDNPTAFATVNSVPSKSTASTGSIALTADTFYEWYATATDATGTTRGPATGYWSFTTLDNIPPAAVTNLNVVHDGPTGSSTPLGTTYLRGVANEVTVNGLTSYSLSGTNSATAGNWAPGNNLNIYLGIRVWKRSAAGVETEITSGTPVAQVARIGAGSGFQTGTWSCPQTALATTDSIVIRVYGETSGPLTGTATLRATFTTAQLNVNQLDATTWSIQYWTRNAGNPNGSDWYWGTATYDNHIDGISTSVVMPATNHNTITWTKSADDGAGADDVMNYKIYRADNSGGPWTTLIATVPPGTTSYVDLNKGLADNITWWYVVRATDFSNNIDMNTNADDEPGASPPEPYNIILVDKSGWVFVSFPIGISDNVQTVLNDAQTTWDVAKWYDGQTKTWKSYRATGTQTLTTLNNQMGVWLHLTANGGDQLLTTSLAGYYPSGEVAINLYTGWNMVGYPSATPRLGTDTLPVQATAVSVWQSGFPYISDSTPGAVTMTEGNAYWVRVNADCVWHVQP